MQERFLKIIIITVAVVSTVSLLTALLFVSNNRGESHSVPRESPPQDYYSTTTITMDATGNKGIGLMTTPRTSILECRLDYTSSPGAVVASARLVDQSSGHGIAGKQMIFTILPGNPADISLTNDIGVASTSLGMSRFSNDKSTLFVFFDGDKEYEFSSCKVDIETAKFVAGEASTNS
jgi:hypothetical protein